MAKKFDYVDLANMQSLMKGLTFKVMRCAEVLDSVLVGLNKQTQIPDKIVAWNGTPFRERPPLSFQGRGRIIIEISQSFTKERGVLFLAKVLEAMAEKESAPAVHFRMHSPTLDVRMRAEVPLRALVKGGENLEGTYAVYLHALLSDKGQEFLYYGITKRGWNARYNEHVQSALRDNSRRLFPAKLKELIEARAAKLSGRIISQPQLSGIITALCAIGLDEDSAMDVEEYLVDKYSLSSKHLNGLNMIPGGREGIRALHRLSLGDSSLLNESNERDELLDRYLKTHPQLGTPNPAVSEKWNDPAYAEAVICGRENRLSVEQVRKIRYLAASGCAIDQIRAQTGALDDGQVSRVLVGRTYSRIS